MSDLKKSEQLFRNAGETYRANHANSLIKEIEIELKINNEGEE